MSNRLEDAERLVSSNQEDPEFFSDRVARARRFCLSLEPPKNCALAVICGGLEYTLSDYAINRHSFPYYSLEYVLRGQGEVKLNGYGGSLQAGQLFSYGPGVHQEMTSDPAEPLVKYFVDFTGNEALEQLHSCSLAPGSISQIFPATGLQTLFDELIHTGLSVHRDSAELCARVLQCIALKINIATVPSPEKGTLAFQTYERCRQHIEKDFQRLKTLDQISEECHVTNGYLCRLFRRYAQESPYGYLHRLKMTHAAEMLQDGDFLVKQVAEHVGFGDEFLFSRRFKNFFDMSPKEFRSLARR